VERAGAAICTNSVVQIMCVEERRERRMGEASLGNTSYPCLFHRVAPETIFCLADMGTTPSSSRPKEETSTNGGFFSNLWLCGGGDAIDENSTERSRRRVASADKETDGRKLRAGADDAKRVTESTESAS
tara:strand:+ start:2713 stop:3102 length:390 start_codon:yes stop_codon:yes gene_type:complete